MKKCPIASSITLILLSSVSAYCQAAVEIGVGAEAFKWEEFKDNGDWLLDETGPRFALFLKTSQPEPDAGGFFTYQAKAAFGSVKYDGALQDGTPIKTDTNYAGLTQELNYHVRVPAGAARFDFIAGAGWDFWRRAIENPVSGGDQLEDYHILFASLGAELAQAGTGFHMGAAVKYPFFTYEDAYLDSYGYANNPTLSPGKAPSLNAEIGYRFANRKTDISLYFDSLHFKQSDKVQADASTTFHQPESKMRMIGLKIMNRF